MAKSPNNQQGLAGHDTLECSLEEPFLGFPATLQSEAVVVGDSCCLRRGLPSGGRLSAQQLLTPKGRHGAQLEGYENRNMTQWDGRENLPPPAYTAFEEAHQREEPARTNVEVAVTPPRCLLSSANLPADPTPILDRVETTRAQWRPPIDDIDSRMIASLKSAFEGLAETIKGTRINQRMTLPKFEGSEWESPQEFLHAIRKTCEREQINQEDWVTLAADQLRRNACHWYENFKPLRLNFEAFERRLLDRYDNVEIRSQLLAKLYGQRQGKEAASIFISRKLALYRRIFPGATEEEKVCHLKTLLVPEIRMPLRGSYIGSTDELIQLATAIEVDLEEISRQTSIQLSNQNRNPPPRPLPRQGGASRSALIRGEARNPQAPPYPCRFCQEDHFHRDCPRRDEETVPARRQLALEAPHHPSRNVPGNEVRVARTQEPHSQPGRRPN